MKKLVDLEKLPDGQLRITVHEGCFSDITALSAREDVGDDEKLRLLLRWQLLHGWQEVPAETVGALTSALLFTDDPALSRLYHYPLYAVHSELRVLLETGELLFSVAYQE